MGVTEKEGMAFTSRIKTTSQAIQKKKASLQSTPSRDRI
jgi:hypothetical protein